MKKHLYKKKSTKSWQDHENLCHLSYDLLTHYSHQAQCDGNSTLVGNDEKMGFLFPWLLREMVSLQKDKPQTFLFTPSSVLQREISSTCSREV